MERSAVPLHRQTNLHVRNPSYPLSSRPKWRDLRSRSTPKPISTSATPLTLCHLDRSGEICGPAPPPNQSPRPQPLAPLVISTEVERSAVPLHPQTNLHVRNPSPPLSSRPKWRDLQFRPTPKPISTSATPLPHCHLDRSGEICSSAPPPNQSPRPQPLLPFVISTEVERSAVPLHPQTNLHVRNPSYPLSSRPKWRDLRSRSTPKPISTSATPLTPCHLDRSGEICGPAPPPNQSPRPQPLLPLVISTEVERSAVPLHPQTNLHVRNPPYPLSSRPKWRDLRSRSTPNQSPRPQPLLPFVISTEVERSAVPLHPQTNLHVRTPLPHCHLDRSGEICGPAPPPNHLDVRNPPYPLSSRPKWRDLRSHSTSKPISTSATPLPHCHLDRSGEICSSLLKVQQRKGAFCRPFPIRLGNGVTSTPPKNNLKIPDLKFPQSVSKPCTEIQTAFSRNGVRPMNSTPADLSDLTGLHPYPLDWLWQDHLAAGTLGVRPTLRRAHSRNDLPRPCGRLSRECRIRRASIEHACRQNPILPAIPKTLINYSKILSPFMKQRTYPCQAAQKPSTNGHSHAGTDRKNIEPASPVFDPLVNGNSTNSHQTL